MTVPRTDWITSECATYCMYHVLVMARADWITQQSPHHVELVLRVQVELAQKAGGGRDVPVVLVLGRLLGLGLDEERSGGAEDMAPVVGCHLVKSSGVAALQGVWP